MWDPIRLIHKLQRNTNTRIRRAFQHTAKTNGYYLGRLRLKCDGTRAETRFRLSAKRTSPFKSAGASVKSTTGSRSVRISGSNDGYTMFRGSVKSTGYPLHSPVSPLLPLQCVIVCCHITNGLNIQPTAYTNVNNTSTDINTTRSSD